MPENMMLALAQRPEAPPALAAQGTQLFPFSSRMQNLRNQVAAAPSAHVATSHLAPKGTHVSTPSPAKRFALNPRLKNLFAESRQVAVTTKAGPSASFYQVGKGDSLYSIAADLLGSGGRWREIYAANKSAISNGYLLKVGQRLTIPGNRAIEAAPVMLAHAKPVPQNTPAKGGYKVAPGDSLYTIAQKRLGNPQRWREIVAMNKAALQGKTVIYPNQWLMLPQQG
jgi:nucleoid-associated protein YgaU